MIVAVLVVGLLAIVGATRWHGAFVTATRFLHVRHSRSEAAGPEAMARVLPRKASDGVEHYLPGPPALFGAPAADKAGFVRVGSGAPVVLPLMCQDEGYATIRRMITSGHLPRPGDVAIGDLVNAFSYARSSGGSEALMARVESGAVPWAPGHVLVRVQVDAREPREVARPPTTVMILADLPPMPHWQERVDAIRASLRWLTSQLRPDDRLGIVALTTDARVELEPTAVANRVVLDKAIDEIGMPQGRRVDDALVTTLELAHGDAAGRGSTWRVLICSDGASLPAADEARTLDLLENSETMKAFSRAVWGQAPQRDLISRLVDEGEARETVIGVNTDAKRVISDLIGDPVGVAATEARLEVAFDPALVKAYRVLGYESGGGPVSAAKGGELLEGESCTTLIELVPSVTAGWDRAGLARITLSYDDAKAGHTRTQVIETPPAKPWAETRRDFRFSAAVAGFGLALQSGLRGTPRLSDLGAWAKSASGDVPAADRKEFLGLLDRTETIAP
ncbi:von Willebrand factor [mine drainage metagenome]|uniref:von Willebrand factor n=1 Tax=mine drainage metagenome TaxID=410659 RepID=A0A1J5S5L8_9ZZZZ